jgi:parallel beta-helix repeat protein
MRRLSCLVVLVGCGGGGDDACKGVTGDCVGISAGASGEDIQQALIDVPAGGTVAFAAGHFDLELDLSLDVDGVTIQGAGLDQTTLSFANQIDGAQGLLVTSNGVMIHDIAVEDTPGDAIKILGATDLTLQRTRVEWTAGPNTTNGSYGLYPVQCHNVIIEDSVVKGASDSGVYVGQSDNVVVRGNDVEDNVAGIEIENTTHADVHDNTATSNTGGILVFNLPGLQVENGAGTRVFHNQVFSNNTTNFAPAGNIVGLVPTGTGIAILAAHGIEIFDNDVKDHLSVNFGIISYTTTMIAITDPNYDQYPTALYIHDNRFSGTSSMPTGELGGLLISAISEVLPNGPYIVPDMVWDGVMDPARVTGGDYAPDDKICIANNDDADFMNLAWPLGDATKPSTDLSPHACSHAPLPGVTL